MATGTAWGADPHVRLARLTLAEGRVEVEHQTGERYGAERNQPVGQGFWVETWEARAELELDEGTLVRLGPQTLVELSDLTRLSTGQRISLISVERGTVYVTGEPARGDALVVVAPGLEVSFLAGSRVRVEGSAVAVLEGRVKLQAPSVEMELTEGQAAQVGERFELLTELREGELDRWSEERDRAAAEQGPELEKYGKWIGEAWRPEAQEGFVPFRLGRWRWYEGMGYLWIGRERWGWLPYRSGTWSLDRGSWVWKPGADVEVVWVRGLGFVGWGATAEALTYAAYREGSREIEPTAGLVVRGTARRVAALPAPPPLPRVARKKTRVGTTRVVPALPELTFDAWTPPPPAVVVLPEPPPTAPVTVVETVPPPEPIYVPVPVAVPEVVVVEKESPPPPPPPPVEVEAPRPRPQPQPAPVTPPVVERSIRLQNPEAGEMRSRRR